MAQAFAANPRPGTRGSGRGGRGDGLSEGHWLRVAMTLREEGGERARPVGGRPMSTQGRGTGKEGRGEGPSRRRGVATRNWDGGGGGARRLGWAAVRGPEGEAAARSSCGSGWAATRAAEGDRSHLPRGVVSGAVPSGE